MKIGSRADVREVRRRYEGFWHDTRGSSDKTVPPSSSIGVHEKSLRP